MEPATWLPMKSAHWKARERTQFAGPRGFTLIELLVVNLIMFSERNSEALNAPDNPDYGSVIQDDYDTWVGEAALVRWGSGKYGDQGWVRYNRHRTGANSIYTDGHVENLRWSKARFDEFPDHRVRSPLVDPPQ